MSLAERAAQWARARRGSLVVAVDPTPAVQVEAVAPQPRESDAWPHRQVLGKTGDSGQKAPKLAVLGRTAATVVSAPLRHIDIRDEQSDLIRRYQAGESAAGDRLLRAHERLILSVAGRYMRAVSGHADDLLQESRLGFLRAVKGLEPDRGSLSTYAAQWIQHQCIRYLQDHRSTIRVPVHTQAALSRARREGATTPEDVAALPIPGAVVAAEVLGTNFSPTSLDAPITGSEDSGTWVDLLASDGPTPEGIVADCEDTYLAKERVGRAMDRLTPRERDVIQRRLLCDEPETLDDVASTYGLSREGSRQVEVRALAKIRRALTVPAMKSTTAKRLAPRGQRPIQQPESAPPSAPTIDQRGPRANASTTTDGRLIDDACLRRGLRPGPLAKSLGADPSVFSNARSGRRPLPKKYRAALAALVN